MYTNTYMSLDDTMYPISEHTEDQQQPYAQYDDTWTYNSMAPVLPNQLPNPQTLVPVYQQPTQYSHLSSLPDPRLSGASDSSGWQRSSMASTNSSWSNMSEQAYYQRRPSLASICSSVDDESPMPLSFATSPTEDSASPLPPRSKRKPRQRQATSDKDLFASCVSRTRRTRRSQREPRYWCTSCEEPFNEKYDWKRHEATYQERHLVFRCSLCTAIYFLEKDFLYHHKNRHNCETCHRDGHLEAAKQHRQIRTGWGCGFCTHYSTNWKDRCNHIAQHFARDGKTMDDWHQTNVILSLLQQPAIHAEWLKILASQPQLRPDFGWNQHNTRRVGGYPENGKAPGLQDQLEYFRPGGNAAALAKLAFSKIAFPIHPPQAPRKDYKDHHTVSLQSLMDQPSSWSQFMNTIPEDPLLADAVCDFDFDFSAAGIAYDDKSAFIH